MRFTGPLSLLAVLTMASLAAAQTSDDVPTGTGDAPPATDDAPPAMGDAPPTTENAPFTPESDPGVEPAVDAAAEPAPAMEPPPKKPAGGWTNKKGQLVLMLNGEFNLSTDKAFKPVSVSPDLSVGVTDKLTVAIEHSTFALTGFRGAAGSGLCVTGEDNGCPSVYRQGGLELIYSVAKGPTAVAIDGGIIIKDLRPASSSKLDTIGKIGAKYKFSAGAFSLVTTPSLWIGLSNRSVTGTDGLSTKLNKDQLWFPVSGWVKPIPALSLGLASGIKGPLSKFADAYTVSLGVLAQVAVSKHLQLGTSFFFGAVTGGDAVKNPEPGTDGRFLQVWAAIST